MNAEIWSKLKLVKLKNYTVHRPTPSYTWLFFSILLIVFGLFIVTKIGLIGSNIKTFYCDTYVEPYYNDCVPCPVNHYCFGGEIVKWEDDSDDLKETLGTKLRNFAIESAKTLFFFLIVACLIFFFHIRKQWIDSHIAIAETLYKELLLELTNAKPQMVSKNLFMRRLDRNYSPTERKFLEQQLEKIRILDEQVSFANEDGDLVYVWASS